MSFLEKFLTFWAGADSSLLSLCPRHVRQKYISIGILVLLTASFAFAAAGYAFWTIFESQRISIALGMLWGAFILNLDRFLLTTFSKNVSYFRQTLHAIPRIVLAVMIGITIAHPIMLRLFLPEIMDRVASDIEESLKNARNGKSEEESKAGEKSEQKKRLLPQWRERDQREKKRDAARVALQQCRDAVDNDERELKCELDGSCGTRHQGVGPVFRNRERLWREKQKSCQDLLQTSIIAEDMRLTAEEDFRKAALDIDNNLKTKIDEIADSYRVKVERLKKARAPSFLTRSEALGNLVKDREQVKATHFGVMLLLVLVEVVPILMKILAPKDSLDELSDATNRSFRELIPELASHLARHGQPSLTEPSEPKLTNATPAVRVVGVTVRSRLRASGIVIVAIGIMTWMPSFNLSLDVSVASAALFVSVAPFILTLLGETGPHGSGL